MSSPRYVFKRVGSEYVTVRVDGVGVAIRTGLVAAGVSIALRGARGVVTNGRREAGGGSVSGNSGLWSVGMAIGGFALAYYGWTGRSIVSAMKGPKLPGRMAAAEAPASMDDEGGAPPRAETTNNGTTVDSVDEASLGSFPASDPPSQHRGS